MLFIAVLLPISLLVPGSAGCGENPPTTSRPYSGGSECVPPSKMASDDPDCQYPGNPNYSCDGSIFYRTSGYYQSCSLNSDCYSSKTPNEWCTLPPSYSWTDKGCFCDPKLGSCIIERNAPTARQWAYCIPQAEFNCDTPSGKCA